MSVIWHTVQLIFCHRYVPCVTVLLDFQFYIFSLCLAFPHCHSVHKLFNSSIPLFHVTNREWPFFLCYDPLCLTSLYDFDPSLLILKLSHSKQLKVSRKDGQFRILLTLCASEPFSLNCLRAVSYIWKNMFILDHTTSTPPPVLRP